MYLSLIFLPLFTSLSTLFLGFLIGRKGAAFLTISGMFVCFILINFIFIDIGYNLQINNLILFNWIDCEFLYVNWGFWFDSLSVSLLYIVCFISFLVHLYSYEYMQTDPHLPRFMAYLSLFTFFMIILVTGDNFLQMFVGWEGVGLASYLLINFWYTRLQANKAAIKAMLINRIADFFLAIGIFAIYYTFKTINYGTVFPLIQYSLDNYIFFFNFKISLIDFISCFLFLGAMGKSAQLGLHTWLPDAMEGPTPVSALIHAATMVTAGVFLIARCSIFFEYSPTILLFVSIIGSCTAFVAGSIGLVQNDLKKVIAYSTCSQLGYMIFACGLSGYHIGIFHLINHAFFKALLFLGAGSIIHSLQDEQDMRRMGGLRRLLPFTYAIMLIGSFSLMGFPFLTGFYSKDAILELALASSSIKGLFCYILGCFAAFTTAFYSIRLLYLTFLTKTRGFRPIITKVHEATPLITLVLAILTFPSICFGFFFKDLFIGMGTDFWGTAININFNNYKIIDSEFLPTSLKTLPVVLSLLGAILSFIYYTLKYKPLDNLYKHQIFRQIYIFLNKKYYFDKLYNEIIGQNILFFSYNISYNLIDKYILEFLGPQGLFSASEIFSQKFQLLHKGSLSFYILICYIILIINFFFL